MCRRCAMIIDITNTSTQELGNWGEIYNEGDFIMFLDFETGKLEAYRFAFPFWSEWPGV